MDELRASIPAPLSGRAGLPRHQGRSPEALVARDERNDSIFYGRCGRTTRISWSSRFGQFDKAETLLDTALQIAEDAGLHEFVFRIERIAAGLRDCQPCEAAAEPVAQSDAVREVSASVALLGR